MPFSREDENFIATVDDTKLVRGHRPEVVKGLDIRQAGDYLREIPFSVFRESCVSVIRRHSPFKPELCGAADRAVILTSQPHAGRVESLRGVRINPKARSGTATQHVTVG